MGKSIIIANLKSNLTFEEGKVWIQTFLKYKDDIDNLGEKEIIICPPFTLLFSFSSAFLVTSIQIGAQNISPFDDGAYTGEINGKQIKDFAKYVLIGHSERRNNFSENDDMLTKKTKLALEYFLTPIFLVQGIDTLIPQGVKTVAYEPTFAIGSGNPDTPENADSVAARINKDSQYQILYGGSVTSENVNSFTSKQNLNGVLVGGASLDPEEFIKIIKNA
jgi:triosephosphate isomerase